MPASETAPDRSRRRWRVLAAVTGLAGPLLLVLGPGPWRWIGLAVLLVAVVLAFLDGYRGWSEA